jgi:hypothetical protein
MTLTVRLDAKTDRAVRALARRRGRTRSDIVREALVHYAALQERGNESRSAYDDWRHVIGIVNIGARHARMTTGEQFTEILRDKARARRSR